MSAPAFPAPTFPAAAMPAPGRPRAARFPGKAAKVLVVALTIACAAFGLFVALDAAPRAPAPGTPVIATRPLPSPSVPANLENTAPAQLTTASLPPPPANEVSPSGAPARLAAERPTVGPRPPGLPEQRMQSSPAAKRAAARWAAPTPPAYPAAFLTRLQGGDLPEEDKESRLHALLQSQPAAAALHAELGLLHANRGDWAEAADSFRAAVAHERRNPDYQHALAVCLEHLRRPSEAITHYRQALELLATEPATSESSKISRRLHFLENAGSRS